MMIIGCDFHPSWQQVCWLVEATGNCHWLVDLLAEIGHELWVGDAASSCQSNRPCQT